jgi:hypothetical protein
MRQLQVTRGQHTVRARRRLEREEILPLDPRDPGLTRARQLLPASLARTRDTRRENPT